MYYSPSRVCLCFVSFLGISSLVSVLPAFKHALCPLLSACWSVCCEFTCYFCSGFHLFVDVCAAFVRAFG
jgi:hypothetical protein